MSRIVAAAGGAFWLVWIWRTGPDAITAWHALGPLVVVPLVLGLLPAIPSMQAIARCRTFTIGLQPLASASVAIALTFPAGVAAAALATPWFIVTLTMAAWGGLAMLTPSGKTWPAHAKHVALCFSAVGGGWTWLHALGRWHFGFSEEIVQLTGVHFHFAGIALPVLAARAAESGTLPMPRVTLAALLASIVALAVGISASPLTELLAASVLATCCIAVAVGQLHLAMRSDLLCSGQLPGTASRTEYAFRLSLASCLFVVSGICAVAAACLAGLYAASEFAATAWIDIPTMAVLHGTANGLGFSTAGLIAWHLKDVAERTV